jgi:hypothetical protein
MGSLSCVHPYNSLWRKKCGESISRYKTVFASPTSQLSTNTVEFLLTSIPCLAGQLFELLRSDRYMGLLANFINLLAMGSITAFSKFYQLVSHGQYNDFSLVLIYIERTLWSYETSFRAVNNFPEWSTSALAWDLIAAPLSARLPGRGRGMRILPQRAPLVHLHGNVHAEDNQRKRQTRWRALTFLPMHAEIKGHFTPGHWSRIPSLRHRYGAFYDPTTTRV